MESTSATGLLEAVPGEAECQSLRAALGEFPTGVTVVASARAAGPCWVTVNSFTSLSLTPPLVVVCLRAHFSAGAIVARNRVFTVDVISGHRDELGRRFASVPLGPRQVRGRGLPPAETGSPLSTASSAGPTSRLGAIDPTATT